MPMTKKPSSGHSGESPFRAPSARTARPRDEKNKAKESSRVERVTRQSSLRSGASKGSQRSGRSRGRPKLHTNEDTEPKAKNPRGRRPKELGAYEVEATDKIAAW